MAFRPFFNRLKSGGLYLKKSLRAKQESSM